MADKREGDITSAAEHSEINSETNNSGANDKRNKDRKQKQEVKESAGETILTSPEVHVDADLSSMDTVKRTVNDTDLADAANF